MRFKGISPVIAAVTFFIVLGVLWAGGSVSYRFRVNEPLKRFLEDSPVVRSYRLERVPGGFGRSEGMRVYVTLAPVKNLKEAYSQVETGIQSILGRSLISFEILDTRDPELEEAFYRVHFSVFEAAMTGSFERMAQVLERESRACRLSDYRAYVDSRRIYVALYKGGHYLYEVVERPQPYDS